MTFIIFYLSILYSILSSVTVIKQQNCQPARFPISSHFSSKNCRHCFNNLKPESTIFADAYCIKPLRHGSSVSHFHMCTYMSCYLVCYFHVLHFDTLHFSPSFSCLAYSPRDSDGSSSSFSCPAFSVNSVSQDGV